MDDYEKRIADLEKRVDVIYERIELADEAFFKEIEDILLNEDNEEIDA